MPDAERPAHAGSDREATYRALTRAADLDAVHDLIVAKGAEVLDLPFPYLVVAARNRARDRYRRRTREDLTGQPELGSTGSAWDPLELVVANDELRRTLERLAAMDDRDVLVVWSSANGLSDAEIVSAWNDLGFQPPDPTPDAIRKRRERARRELSSRVRGRRAE
jgi:hypothetical protein